MNLYSYCGYCSPCVQVRQNKLTNPGRIYLFCQHPLGRTLHLDFERDMISTTQELPIPHPSSPHNPPQNLPTLARFRNRGTVYGGGLKRRHPPRLIIFDFIWEKVQKKHGLTKEFIRALFEEFFSESIFHPDPEGTWRPPPRFVVEPILGGTCYRLIFTHEFQQSPEAILISCFTQPKPHFTTGKHPTTSRKNP